MSVIPGHLLLNCIATAKMRMLARIDVARSMGYKQVYKYLTYESGLKMLSNTNLQFTRAKDLDDVVDCHISKVNFDCLRRVSSQRNSKALIESIYKEAQDAISSFGICSLGTTSDNNVLWDTYTKTNEIANGICIALDHRGVINCLLDKHNQKVASLKVDYIDNPVESIPYEWFKSKDASERYKFMSLLFATKTKSKWEEQKEIRLILPQELTRAYQRYELFKDCFKAIYLGPAVTEVQRKELQEVVNKQNLDVEIFPFRH